MVHLEPRRGRGHGGGSFDIDSSTMNEYVALAFVPPDIANFVIIALCSIVFLGAVYVGFRHGYQSSLWIFIASSFGITSAALNYVYSNTDGWPFEVTRTTQIIIMLYDAFTWIALYDIIRIQKMDALKHSKWHLFMLLCIVVCMVLDLLPVIGNIGNHVAVVGTRLTLWWLPAFFAIYYVCQKYITHRQSLIATVVCMVAMPLGRTIIFGIIMTSAQRFLVFQVLWAVFDHMLPTIGLLFALVHIHKILRPNYSDREMGYIPPSTAGEPHMNK